MINVVERTISQFRRYLEETLGIAVKPTRWRGRDQAPFLLQHRYGLYEVRILEKPCILLVDSDDAEQSPATIRKQMAMLAPHADGELIYVRDRMTSYNRRRLIAQKVPFVVPGNQMYLPTLGIDLREHFRKLRSESTSLSPAAQAVVLSWLLSERQETATPSTMAKCLGYTVMSMSRAFDELESASLGEFSAQGRERCAAPPVAKAEFWAKARPLLKSPVKRRIHVDSSCGQPPGVHAGLTALAHCTMLAEPTQRTFAMTSKEWKTLEERGVATEVPQHEPDAFEVEIWSYDPRLFARDGWADRLSLYLSLKDHSDERVDGALREMMEGLGW